MNGLSVEPGSAAHCHIDPAGPLVVEIASGPDVGQHLARPMIDGEDRDRNVRPERAGPIAREFLETCLPSAIDGEPDQGMPRQSRHGIIGGVGGERRHGRACRRHWLGLRLHDFRRGEDAGSRHPVEDAVKCKARGLDGAIGPPRLRRLRQRHQQRSPPSVSRLGSAEIASAAARTPPDCRHRRHAGVKREYRLGEMALDLDGANDWRSLRQRRRAARNRATCMVRVEPPDTMPWAKTRAVARIKARGRRRRSRKRLFVRSAMRDTGSTPSARTGRRQRPCVVA